MSHPRLVLTAEDDESFDPATVRNWRDEGFQVSYLPFTGGGKSRKGYERELQHLPDALELELGEKYAIVGWFLVPFSHCSLFSTFIISYVAFIRKVAFARRDNS